MALPAATVSKDHPMRLIQSFDYLHEESSHAKVVFRLYDSASVSPLVWSGSHETSGFSCPSRNLAGLTPSAYRVAQAEKRGSVTWAEGPYLAQTVVDHILGKWRQTSLNLTALEYQDADIPEDEKSPWISTSKNLPWCIWEIARRLIIQLDKATKNRTTQEGIEIHMSLIKHHSGTVGLKDPRRVYLEAHVDASSPVGNTLRAGQGVLSMSIRNAYELALREARRSKEILYYGRIFVESIDSDTVWTSNSTGFPLPVYFFKPTEHPSPTRSHVDDVVDDDGEDWLERLIWDPRYDDYEVAMQKINMNKRRIINGW